MTDSDVREVSAAEVDHAYAKSIGYIEAVQDAARAIRNLIVSRKGGLVVSDAYFEGLDDAGKELGKLLAEKCQGV